MCEFLVFVVDKVNHDDPAKDARCYKAGDVVVVKPDGHQWGVKERTRPEWTIVKAPGMSVDDGNELTEEPKNLESLRTEGKPSRRAERIDLVALGARRSVNEATLRGLRRVRDGAEVLTPQERAAARAARR